MAREKRKSTKVFEKFVFAAIAGVVLLFAGCVNSSTEAAEQISQLRTDPAPGEYLFASGMHLPSTLHEKTFFPDENRANFTSFEGLKDITVQGNKLSFIVTEKSAILGWRNYQGKQPLEEIVSTFQKINLPVIRIRQTGGEESQWSAGFWRDGSRMPGGQNLISIPQ